MDSQSKKAPPRIRTFAQDLERERIRTGQATPPGLVNNIETPKLAPATSTSASPPPTERIVDAPLPAAPSSTHIPAFHELQRKSTPVTTIKEPVIRASSSTHSNSTPAKKVIVRAKKRDLKATRSVGGGTIITDSKSGKFKLLPAIIKSVDGWLLSLAKAFKRKTAPKYIITDTQMRRGVIQKATSKTGSIFTADNETLREEILRRQRFAGKKPDQSDDVDLFWSPNTDVGYALLPPPPGSTVTSKVQVEFKRQSVPAPVIVEPVVDDSRWERPEPEIQKPPTPTLAPAPTITPPVFVEPSVPEPVIPEPPYQEEDDLPLEESEEIYSEELPEVEPEFTVPEAHYKVRGLGEIAKLNTNLLSVIIAGGLVGIVVIILIVKIIFTFISGSEEDFATRELAIPITPGVEVVDTTLPDLSQESIATALWDNSVQNTNPTELRLVDAVGNPIEPRVLLPLLGFNNSVHLNRLVTDVRVGASGIERTLIFEVTDQLAAFGSMLTWEDTLPSDLSKTLGIPESQIVESFKDVTIGKVDARVAVTNDGTEVLIYGFITEDTIVIARNLDVFSKFLGAQ